MNTATKVRLGHIIVGFAILAIVTWLGLDPPDLGAKDRSDKANIGAECVPGEEKCKGLSTALICSESGKWEVKQKCKKGTTCTIDSWGDGSKYAGCFETVDLRDVLPDEKDKKDKKPRYEFPTDVTVEGAFRAYVEKVSDGDTIKVRLLPSGEKQTVRLLGIDCPESHKNKKCKRDGKAGRHDCDWQIPRGLKASKRAAKLLKRKTVYLECEGKCKKGRFGRALRYVRIDHEVDFGLQLVKEGYCEDFGFRYPHPRGEEYLKAQDEAKKARRGIWKEEE